MSQYSVVIADDEEIERKALCLLLQKEFPEISIAAVVSNGMELVTVLQEKQPDIAIVDVNMPGINGIDAIDLLRARGCKTHFIINTAYNDFNYIQQALSLKIDAYILKPEKRDTTIQTIRKICTQIDVARQNRHSQEQIQELFTRVQSVMESEIMYSLFIGEPALENFETYCEMHGISFESGVVAALIPREQNSWIQTQDKEVLRNVLDTALGSSCAYLATITKANICLLLFVKKDSAPEQQRWVGDVLRVALDKLHRYLHLSLRAGVGGIYNTFDKMGLSYQESLLALMSTPAEGISFYCSQRMQQHETSESLVCQLREGNCQRISTEMARLSPKLQDDHAMAQFLWQAISNSLNQEAEDIPQFREQLEYTASQIDHLTPQADPTCLIQDSLYRLSGLMENRENKNPESTYVGQALSYIAKHYAEDISLDAVAEEIGISPYYLSRLFKAERGESFVEYLTTVRMKEAVRLAKETRLSIKEIATRTGYASTTYFCRVFKRYTGSTIGELREHNRKKQF